MHASTFRRIRPWVQLASFLLFLFLLIRAGHTGFLSTDLFYRLDPLVGLASMVRGAADCGGVLVGTLIAPVAAFVFGRAWCGWICPLGTVIDWAPAHKPKLHEVDPRPWLRKVKYFILLLILLLALLGNMTLMILDPITLLYRTITTAFWPALDALITAAEPIVYKIPFLQGPSTRSRPRCAARFCRRPNRCTGWASSSHCFSSAFWR